MRLWIDTRSPRDPHLIQHFDCAVLWLNGPRRGSELTQQQTATLIRAAEKTVKDPAGWAADLLDVLQLHGLPASKENICASIAVIDQESNFVANPAVAGLGQDCRTGHCATR